MSEDEQCFECGYYRGHHADSCGHTTIEQLRERLKSVHELEKRNRTACEIQFRRMKEQLTLWQGKFHALRHENNKLRRRQALAPKEGEGVKE
jgi:uncharacterized protein (DUF305 family)